VAMCGIQDCQKSEFVQNVNQPIGIEKKCSKCEKSKPVSEFSKSKATKDGLDYRCKFCKKQYYQVHKEEIVTYNKEYYQAHKEEIAEYCRVHKEEIAEYYQAHKEERAEYGKEYCQTHKEEIAEYRRVHKEEIAEYGKEYRQTEAGKIADRKGSHKRRALKAGADHEVFDDREIFERDGFKCQLCGYRTRPDYKNPNHPLYPNLDHIVPLSKGGSHTRLNTQCLCHRCNMIKHNTGTGDQLRMF